MSHPNVPLHPESSYHDGSNLPRGNQYFGSSAESYSGRPTGSRTMGINGIGILIRETELNVFAELHGERIYLINCLEHENKKAKNILRKILDLEDTLLLYPKSLGRRDGKQKKLGWLRYRIKETNHQEQAILARLGQISFEIQTRDRWIQVKAERNIDFQPSQWSQIQKMQFNATPDNFQLGTSTMTYIPSNQLRTYKPKDSPSLSLIPNQGVDLATEDNSQPNDTSRCNNSNLETEIVEDGVSQTLLKLPRSSSMDFAELIALGTASAFPPGPRNKRRSL